jgi:hypothetical protein
MSGGMKSFELPQFVLVSWVLVPAGEGLVVEDVLS